MSHLPMVTTRSPPSPGLTALTVTQRITQVTWTGAIRLEHGGVYELHGAGNLRVFLEGQPFEGAHYLGRGMYALRVVRDAGLSTEASLSWKIGQADFVPVPSQAVFHVSGVKQGLLATYWNNQDWRGDPLFHQVTPFLLLAWPDEQPIVPNGPFSARFTGALHIVDGGSYEFRVEADDGARLTIDDAILGEALTAGQPNNIQAAMDLTAGYHRIQIDYFQQGGGSALRLFWRRPNGDWEPIPPDAMTPAQP